jgi:hypothetical protein
VLRHLPCLDVPDLRQLRDVLVVGPIAKSRQVTVGTGLARLLRGRLTVRLQHAGARSPSIPRSRSMLLSWHADAVAS